MKLDDKDRIIITMYAEDPDISQEKIAARLNMTQPSVAARVAALRKEGGLEKQLGVNPIKMGMYLAKVEASCTAPRDVLKKMRGCPYFAHGFTASGRRNLFMLFFSESITTLESIVDCHLRSDPSVSEVDLDLLITSEKDFVIPIRMKPDLCDGAPCGIEHSCYECSSFKEEKCLGCPATGQYRGNVLGRAVASAREPGSARQ
ncbi:Lrp/AsnC family transcriptional regulator [Methanomassiliicoccus luminyensis]|jgi:Lrp/AsnC family leucine-responsive transcriptional regulator|nr:Lrp/AsnC family transcriptional regulator [Methanomassiliicoccus luminyensis]